MALVVALCCVSGQEAFAAGAPAPDAAHSYTAAEAGPLATCLALTSQAKYFVEQKNLGRRAADVSREIKPGPLSALLVRLVDKIYTEETPYSWDYAVAFFNECAPNLANVPVERATLANFCMQNSLIAETAQKLRDAGISRDDAHAQFAKFAGAMPIDDVDSVYSHDRGTPNEALKRWNSCMSPLIAP